MGRRRIEPGQGQESVWDYPRPPRPEDVDKKIKAVFGGVTLAYITRAKRVLDPRRTGVIPDGLLFLTWFYSPAAHEDLLVFDHLRLYGREKYPCVGRRTIREHLASPREGV